MLINAVLILLLSYRPFFFTCYPHVIPMLLMLNNIILYYFSISINIIVYACIVNIYGIVNAWFIFTGVIV